MYKIIIPYKHSGTPELKYALRSIEKFLNGWDKIIIVGDKPPLNIDHIPFEDHPRKNYSMFLKVVEGMAQVDEDFLYWHDDHFLLKPLEAIELKAYYNGTCKKMVDRLKSGGYCRYTKATINYLNNPDALYYDIHVPCKMKKSEILSLPLKWDEEMIFKSLYLNSFLQVSEQMSDLKLDMSYRVEQIKSVINHRLFFSTGDYGMGKNMRDVLNELYPDKSKYE